MAPVNQTSSGVDCDEVVTRLADEHDTLTGAQAFRLDEHLATCAACRAHKASRSAASACLDDNAVAALVEGALSATDRMRITAHLDRCETCLALTSEAMRVSAQEPVALPVRLAPGAELGRYVLLDTIGRGGMGRITRAYDRRLGREVAIKEVLDLDHRLRFEREALITARLQHPAIVPVYEAGQWPDGVAFYTMRLVSGGTLADAISRAPTLAARLALLPSVTALTEALGYAHARRVIHRDLKPSNVLVGEFGETVVIDWGLAKDLDHDDGIATRPTAVPVGGLTSAGSVLGTPGYMSPEQALGEPLDQRADVYALGAILYHLLAGRSPYADLDCDPDQLVALGAARPPTPIATLAPDAPEDLRAIVERAMARPAAARYAHAGEMAAELRRFAAGQLIASRAYRVRDLLARWIRRHRAAVAVGSVLFAALAAVAITAFVSVTRSRDAERDARGSAEVARTAADDARTRATSNLGALLEEQGRGAYLAGEPERALAYLGEAAAQGRDTVALRALVASASTDLALGHTVLDPHHRVIAVALGTGGHAATVDDRKDGSLVIWKDDAIRVSTSLGHLVTDATFDADAAHVAVHGHRVLSMWDAVTAAPLWKIVDPALEDVAVVASFDPHARLLALFADAPLDHFDPEIREVATGALRGRLHVRGEVVALAFRADGEEIAIATRTGELQLFDATTLAQVRTLATGRALTTLAFAGVDRIVAGAEHGEALLWHVGDAASSLRTLSGHEGAVTALAVSTREEIATGDAGGTLRLWSADGTLLGESREHRGKLELLRFSPDGRLLLGGGQDTHAHLWDVSGLGVRRVFEAFAETAAGLAWASDGARLATVGDDERRAHVWTTPRGTEIARFPGTEVAATDELVVTATPGALITRRADTGESTATVEITTLPTHDAIHALQLSRDAKRALLAGFRGAQVFDLAAGVQTFAIEGGFAVAPKLSADGRFVLYAGHDDVLHLLDAHGRPIYQAPDEVSDGAVSAEGAWIAAVAGDPRPRLWEVATQRAITLPDLGKRIPSYVKLDRTGGRMFVGGLPQAVVIDTVARTTLATLSSTSDLDDGVFDASGAHLLTWGYDHTVTLWRLAGAVPLASVAGVAPDAYAITDDAARFATGHDDGTIKIWDGATGRLLETIHAHRKAITALAFAARGRRLVAGSADGTATIWDVELDRRSLGELAAAARRGSAWRLVDGLLVRQAR